MSLLLFTVWLNIIDEVVLVWSNFVSSTQWSDKETSVNRSSTWIILYHTSYTPPDASLHIHHHNRHLLTTGDNSITSPDVSATLHLSHGESVISLILNYAKRECRQYPPGIETLVQRITHLLWNIILWVQLPSSAPDWFLSIINFITKKIFWYIWKILSI